MTDLDLDAIMAKHCAVQSDKAWSEDVCATCIDPEYGSRVIVHPCETFELAKCARDAKEEISNALELLAFDGTTDLLYAVEKRARQNEAAEQSARDAEASALSWQETAQELANRLNVARDRARDAEAKVAAILDAVESVPDWWGSGMQWHAVKMEDIEAAVAPYRAALGGDHEQPEPQLAGDQRDMFLVRDRSEYEQLTSLHHDVDPGEYRERWIDRSPLTDADVAAGQRVQALLDGEQS